jgi:hypothetical protein
VLVDLERNAVVDLPPDWQAKTFATWPRYHPSVEIIGRDRAGAMRMAPGTVLLMLFRSRIAMLFRSRIAGDRRVISGAPCRRLSIGMARQFAMPPGTSLMC